MNLFSSSVDKSSRDMDPYGDDCFFSSPFAISAEEDDFDDNGNGVYVAAIGDETDYGTTFEHSDGGIIELAKLREAVASKRREMNSCSGRP